jgi:uncharacterized membrane protein
MINSISSIASKMYLQATRRVVLPSALHTNMTQEQTIGIPGTIFQVAVLHLILVFGME